jgi:hypothetical protein
MHATIRRYDGVDVSRTDEVTKKVSEHLTPQLSTLPGFAGYYLIEAGNGVMTSIGLFENAEQVDEASRVASEWIREDKLETALPNAPKITTGKVVAFRDAAVAVA